MPISHEAHLFKGNGTFVLFWAGLKKAEPKTASNKANVEKAAPLEASTKGKGQYSCRKGGHKKDREGRPWL